MQILSQSFEVHKNIPPESPSQPPLEGSKPSQADVLISQLLLSFVERKMSPQTIADTLEAQILEAGITPSALSQSSCNGLIEVLASAKTLPNIIPLLAFFSMRSDFPNFLTSKSSVVGLQRLICILRDSIESSTSDLPVFDRLLGGFAQSFAFFLLDKSQNGLRFQDISQLVQEFECLVRERPHFAQRYSRLYDLLMKIDSVHHLKGTPQEPEVFSGPEELIERICTLPEHILASRKVSQFKLRQNNGLERWKIQNFEILNQRVDAGLPSSYHACFLAEWFFDGVLRQYPKESHFRINFRNALIGTLTHRTKDFTVCKGVAKALQKDMCYFASELESAKLTPLQFKEHMQECQEVFLAFVVIARTDLTGFTRKLSPILLQLDVEKKSAALFTKEQLKWVKALASHLWEEDLNAPPAWVVCNASRLAAQICTLTPGFWLLEHIHLFVEVLHTESLKTTFKPTQQITDYVEHICRMLRKKSPYFGSSMELFAALFFLDRATDHEKNQLTLYFTRIKLSGKHSLAGISDISSQYKLESLIARKDGPDFGPHPIARALRLLVKVSKEANIQAIKSKKISGFIRSSV